ncbi:MAG: class I SAM-dependent methyltransferase [Arcobacter sp.]|nr:class I SAM-dependent methyltransferase [Arcobacter sp.]
MKIESRYLDGTYMHENPDWDRQDALWKANMVAKILKEFNMNPKAICEIGCGSGDILSYLLGNHFTGSEYYGFDIALNLEKFWKEHTNNPLINNKIKFQNGDFHKINRKKYDLICMLDVFEHVRDPFTFLEESVKHADYFVFHIPLDLSAISVLRNKPLMNVRKKVGHLHYYTKDLALETLKDCGYEVISWNYTGASLNSPNRSIKTKLASIPRKIFYSINKDIGVRLLGGETLIVLAKPNL